MDHKVLSSDICSFCVSVPLPFPMFHVPMLMFFSGTEFWCCWCTNCVHLKQNTRDWLVWLFFGTISVHIKPNIPVHLYEFCLVQMGVHIKPNAPVWLVGLLLGINGVHVKPNVTFSKLYICTKAKQNVSY